MGTWAQWNSLNCFSLQLRLSLEFITLCFQLPSDISTLHTNQSPGLIPSPTPPSLTLSLEKAIGLSSLLLRYKALPLTLALSYNPGKSCLQNAPEFASPHSFHGSPSWVVSQPPNWLCPNLSGAYRSFRKMDQCVTLWSAGLMLSRPPPLYLSCLLQLHWTLGAPSTPSPSLVYLRVFVFVALPHLKQ